MTKPKTRREWLLGSIGLLTAAGAGKLAPAHAAPAKGGSKPLTLLFVGDSITAAPWGRRRLKADLGKAGYRTDFVGTQFGANPEGGFTDGEHEGYPGCKIADVAAKLTAPGTGGLARFDPDIVLVLLGTNDIGQGQVAGAADRLAALLGQIRRAKPRAHLFVGTIPAILPNAFSGYNTHASDVPMYNRAVMEAVAGMRKRDLRLHLVDVHAALPATNEYVGDGVHPTGYGIADKKDGYARLGDAFFRAIQAAIPLPA